MQPFDNLKLYYAATRRIYHVYAVVGIVNVVLMLIFFTGSDNAIVRGILQAGLFFGLLYAFLGESGARRAGRFLTFLDQPEYQADFFYPHAMRENHLRVRSIGFFALLFFGSIIFFVISMLTKKNPQVVPKDEIALAGILLGLAIHALLSIIMLWYLHRQARTYLRGWV